MLQQRLADLVWIGEEVIDFDRIQRDAERYHRSVPDEIKISMKKL
jgi:isocitrate lyase